ncbi:hypothetical protein GQ55_1G085800 [Panicum hallii var. hallii]|uniref:Uncharacterized protein n=1 Tax=Panicum hallii var. hallii TaxID=1504633 RepID=A0A2T7F3M7_9POAL|nr:hypothetical protein GQ55_1G085800 [Panicum hallii var. hallii]
MAQGNARADRQVTEARHREPREAPGVMGGRANRLQVGTTALARQRRLCKALLPRQQRFSRDGRRPKVRAHASHGARDCQCRLGLHEAWLGM